MRLTCPNCGAEYEVPDEVIPTSGRDVQCSNCGDTWFQYHRDHMPADDVADAAPDVAEDAADADFDDAWSGDDIAADAKPPADDEEDEVEDAGAGDDAGDAPTPDIAPEDTEDDAEPEEDDDDADDDDRAGGPPPLRRRPLSPEVKSILQEEASFAERSRHGDPLESQPELGLGDPVPPPPARREAAAESRLSRVRQGEPAREAPKPREGETAAPRRDLLPDIEEINSTLRRKGETLRPDGRIVREATRQEQRGFRGSFMSVLILAIVAVIIYLQAPKIGTAIPPLAGPMEGYVAAVDTARLWLDEKAAQLAAKLDAMTAETGE